MAAARRFFLALGGLLSVVCSVQAAQIPTPAVYSAYADTINIADYYARAAGAGLRLWWDGAAFVDEENRRYTPPAWFSGGFPDTTVDGLLTAQQLENDAIKRLLRAPEAEAGWRRLSFTALDLPDAGGDFESRLQQLEQLVAAANLPNFNPAPWKMFTDTQDLQTALEQMYRDGGDGYILVHRSADYDDEEERLLLALPYELAQAVVLAHRPGKGEYTGMMGGLEVMDDNGAKFVIGSGFTRQQRRQPPEVNSRIAFKYKGYTATGKPKSPVFLHIVNATAEEQKIAGVLSAVHLSWIFIALMGILTFLDAITHLPGGRRWNFKSAIVSTGLLGTFIGVFWGLYNFNTADIVAGVPTLLEGLKLAFITSIVGIALSTALSIVQTILGVDK